MAHLQILPSQSRRIYTCGAADSLQIELWLEEKVGERIGRLTRSGKSSRETFENTAVTDPVQA